MFYGGDMSYDNIKVNTQSSIRIEGTKVIYFDAFQIKEEPHDADVICVTHAHYDHFDTESIEKIRKQNTVFIAPAGMADEIGKIIKKEQLFLVAPGEVLEIDDLKLEIVPAYNKLKPFHPKHNKWVGYILEMGGTRYYIAGDTDAVKDLHDIKCDVALVPIGGTYTMNAKEAAELINKIKPTAAIPTHYGGIVGKPEDEELFRKLVNPEIRVVKKIIL